MNSNFRNLTVPVAVFSRVCFTGTAECSFHSGFLSYLHGIAFLRNTVTGSSVGTSWCQRVCQWALKCKYRQGPAAEFFPNLLNLSPAYCASGCVGDPKCSSSFACWSQEHLWLCCGEMCCTGKPTDLPSSTMMELLPALVLSLLFRSDILFSSTACIKS
ncbi:hypothetical protein EK904_009248 [Melospiza melodia maxima]|nr:hypothetical protein EK904_009248 [Melospiza melodia maxima]